jgi:hypothetical protein
MTAGDLIKLHVMTDNKYETSGPYSIIDGVVSDAEIWRAEMDEETERKFDEYMLAKAIKEAAEEELARRAKRDELIKQRDEAFYALMAPFFTKPRK